MREILFRGKSKVDSTGWKYGDLLHSINGVCFIRYKQPIVGNGYEFRNCEVDPETVGQYTGLTDRNGTKIFEGDILESIIKPISKKLGHLLTITDIRKCDFTALYVNQYVVSGNIHDNPSLYGVTIGQAIAKGLADGLKERLGSEADEVRRETVQAISMFLSVFISELQNDMATGKIAKSPEIMFDRLWHFVDQLRYRKG